METYTNGNQTVRSHSGMSLNSPAKVKEPQLMDGQHWLLYMFYARGDFETCRKLINDYDNDDGSIPDEYSHFLTAEMLRAEEKYHECLEEYQKCLTMNPKSADNLKNIAEILYLLKNYQSALDYYEKAEKISGTSDWEILFSVGKCLLKLNKKPRAIDYIKKAVHYSHEEEPFILLNKLLVANNDLQTSISICSTTLEYISGSSQLHTELGLSHIRLGQFEQGLEQLENALELDPLNYPATLALGCIMQRKNDHETALVKYRVAAQFVGDSASLWSNVGLCFYAKQKYVAAISCLLRSLWQSPMNWKVLYNLGLVHLSTHQPASAFHYLFASVNYHPEYPYSYMLLALTLDQLHDYENARKAFEKSLELSADDPIILINYSVVELNNKHLEESRNILVKLFTCTEGRSLDVQVLKLMEQVQVGLKQLEIEEKQDQLIPDEREIQLDPDEV